MPGNFRKISDEEKTAVMTAMKPLLDQGWTFNSAYNQVKSDFLAEEKKIPAFQTVQRWFKPAPEAPNTAPPSAPSTVSTASTVSIEVRDSYTHRLELICKLYRTRSEASCDAICDELLPELLTQEE